MFLNLTLLKKELFASFKTTGLYIGKREGQFFISDGSMGFCIEEEYTPKKLKGILVELIGELPKEGTCFRYRKDLKTEKGMELFDLKDRWRGARDCVVQTPLILKEWTHEMCLFQRNENRELVAVDRVYVDLLSDKELDLEIEDMPGRPAYESGILYWHNATMTYFACETKMKEAVREVLFPTLQTIAFAEKEMSSVNREQVEKTDRSEGRRE